MNVVIGSGDALEASEGVLRFDSTPGHGTLAYRETGAGILFEGSCPMTGHVCRSSLR